jgi:glycine dehydrogenase subunit 1
VRTCRDTRTVLAEVGRLGYHGGIDLGQFYPGLAGCNLFAVTEKRTRAEIDGLVDAYATALEQASP